jgi:hypothetical protein
MTILLLVMTDGREDCIKRSIPSALAMLDGPITNRVIHDDSGDPYYQEFLRANFPTFDLISGHERLGFGGAIRNAWGILPKLYDFSWCFHLEDDFLFNVEIPLVKMIQVLESYPYLQQMALRRQPWNEREHLAGGVIEQYSEDFFQKENWIEHRRWWTTNPCLYRRELCGREWPVGTESEGHFGIELFRENPEYQSAFWGLKSDAPQVHHIGNQRIGIGY